MERSQKRQDVLPLRVIARELDGRLDHLGSFHLPEIGIVTSLVFIVATLTITTVVSLLKTSRDARRAAAAAGTE